MYICVYVYIGIYFGSVGQLYLRLSCNGSLSLTISRVYAPCVTVIRQIEPKTLKLTANFQYVVLTAMFTSKRKLKQIVSFGSAL